jgi:hypothetical protein
MLPAPARAMMRVAWALGTHRVLRWLLQRGLMLTLLLVLVFLLQCPASLRWRRTQ